MLGAEGSIIREQWVRSKYERKEWLAGSGVSLSTQIRVMDFTVPLLEDWIVKRGAKVRCGCCCFLFGFFLVVFFFALCYFALLLLRLCTETTLRSAILGSVAGWFFLEPRVHTILRKLI